LNPFHLIKALFASLVEAFRRGPEGPAYPGGLPPVAPAPKPRRERKPLPRWLKPAFAFSLLAVALVLIGVQLRRGDGDRPPSWVKIETLSSPALPSTAFRFLAEECAKEAARRHLPVVAMRALALEGTNGVALFWSTEPMVNPGFSPISQVDRKFQPRRDAWVGYYHLDGTPMRYTQRNNPAQTNSIFVSVHLDPPLAPGATQVVARVNKVVLRLRPNRAGNFEVFQGRFPPSPGVMGCAVALPLNAEWVRMAPLSAAKKTEGDTTFVWWLSTRTESNAQPMSVEFKVK
jgi:hypothetical protein